MPTAGSCATASRDCASSVEQMAQMRSSGAGARPARGLLIGAVGVSTTYRHKRSSDAAGAARAGELAMGGGDA